MQMFHIIFFLSIIHICSAIVVNYDLLVADMSFYNQTLMFALSENKKNGKDMLQLIENLMAHDAILVKEKKLVNDCISASQILKYSVVIMSKINRFGFFVTIVFMIMSYPYNFYLEIKNTKNMKKKTFV